MSHDDLEKLLRDVKKCKRIRIVDREKNRKMRYDLNITIADQEDIVRNLTIQEYCKGPLEDDDPRRNQYVWVFKTQFDETPIYVKITDIKRDSSGAYVDAISCHIDYD